MFEKYLGGLKEPFKKELFMGGLLMIWAVLWVFGKSHPLSHLISKQFDFSEKNLNIIMSCDKSLSENILKQSDLY